MHDAAFQWVSTFASNKPLTAVEIGGRNVNGHVRDLFPNTTWYVIDAQSGTDVDEVANGATWRPAIPVDLVVCTEVFEHTPLWAGIVANIFTMLRSGGCVILTMAGPGRAPHGVDLDNPDQAGYYRNIAPTELGEALHGAGFVSITVNQHDEDVRAVAIRP